MTKHQIRNEINDMRGEFHATRSSRKVIIVCSVIAVAAIVVFLVLSVLNRLPPIAPSPVVQGAANAFDVAEPEPSSPATPSSASSLPAGNGSAASHNGAGPQEQQEEIPPLTVPGIQPVELGGSGGGSGSSAPPVVYTPAAP